jgi:hypothetical protein
MEGMFQVGLVVIDCGIDHDPFDPAFEGAFTAELMDLRENLDESVLHNIFGIDTVLAITHTDTQHDRGIIFEKQVVRFTLAFQTPYDDLIIGIHPLYLQ